MPSTCGCSSNAFPLVLALSRVGRLPGSLVSLAAPGLVNEPRIDHLFPELAARQRGSGFYVHERMRRAGTGGVSSCQPLGRPSAREDSFRAPGRSAEVSANRHGPRMGVNARNTLCEYSSDPREQRADLRAE